MTTKPEVPSNSSAEPAAAEDQEMESGTAGAAAEDLLPLPGDEQPEENQQTAEQMLMIDGSRLVIDHQHLLCCLLIH